MRDRPLPWPEAVAGLAVATLAALITAAYVWGRVAPLSPFALLGFTLATAVVLVIALSGRSAGDRSALLMLIAVFALALGGLLRLAWPALLPTGGGPDLTHHLQLVDYLERHWRLPDASLESVLGEMTHYTPGLHLVAALAGAWSGSTGLQAVYPVVAFSVALKLAIVFLITLRVVPERAPRLPLALAAVVLALAPRAYVLDSFVRDSFLAQVFAELFAVAMWWALAVWDARPSPLAMLLFAAAGVAAFLTWPLWIGPPMVAVAATVLTRGDLFWRERLRHLVIAVGPIALIAAVHFAGRASWVRMAAATGAVLQPSVGAFGWLFVVLATLGMLAAILERRARTTLVFVIALVVQAMSLYAVARSAGASTPYMAFKMVYLLVYPLAVVAACGVGVILTRRVRPTAEAGRFAASVAWVLLFVLAAREWEQLQMVRLRPPTVSQDLDVAGRWARGHVEAACFEYIVPNADTAYWLHLAVLGNPRGTPRAADNDTYDPSRNVLRWMQPGGLPYAIVHLPTASKDVFVDADALEQFGTAAILRRNGPASCPEAERLAASHNSSIFSIRGR